MLPKVYLMTITEKGNNSFHARLPPMMPLLCVTSSSDEKQRSKDSASFHRTHSLSSSLGVGCPRTLFLLFSITPTEPSLSWLPFLSLLNLLCDGGKTSYGLNFLTVSPLSHGDEPLKAIIGGSGYSTTHLSQHQVDYNRGINLHQLQEPIYLEMIIKNIHT